MRSRRRVGGERTLALGSELPPVIFSTDCMSSHVLPTMLECGEVSDLAVEIGLQGIDQFGRRRAFAMRKAQHLVDCVLQQGRLVRGELDRSDEHILCSSATPGNAVYHAVRKLSCAAEGGDCAELNAGGMDDHDDDDAADAALLEKWTSFEFESSPSSSSSSS
jgi:hypothetical protein